MSAFVTSAIAVYLIVRENMAAWPIGIVSLALYTVFFYQARLFGDAYLQTVFIVAQVHGWISWASGRSHDSELVVARTSRIAWAWLSLALLACYAILVPILFQVEGKQPWIDGLTTSMSLAAQYMLNRKLIENWLIWIAVDLIYVPWYWKLGYHATSVLYVVFLVLAIAGWRQWQLRLTSPPAKLTD